jgi:hypothetical protein
MPLFNPKTVAAAIAGFDRQPTQAEQAAAERWAALARIDFHGQNESQLEPELNSILMQGALGYRPAAPDAAGTIKAKQPVGGGIVDLAIGNFTGGTAQIVAPFELKGPRTTLDAIMPGRAKTPVQQAWDYANDAVGARWVLVSNMRELRLYAIGHGRAAFESFDLRRIDDPDALRRLQLFVHADRLLGGATADLLKRSASEDRDITDALYSDYRKLRDDLIQFVRDQRPQVGAEDRIALVQKLLDRLVFIAFAEDSVLLPDESIRKAVEFTNPYDPKPKWIQICRLFDAIDKGAPPLDIPLYNGGLFETDHALDALDLPDMLVERFLDIAAYDFASEVSVAILGHIFEQSISDIEAMQAEARGEAPPRTTTRKRFGVVYTPEFVTRFIVERTIGLHLREMGETLLREHAREVDAQGNIRWKGKQAERDYWRAYLDRLTRLRIVDPACGSGAFLIAAFDFLHAEQRRVRERLAEIDGGILAWSDPNADAEIITANLHGVDVNAESVEITKLSLWLKTAKRGRPLETLDLNIRCGNSLIEDSDFHARAFVWRDDFPDVVAEGGFDIVIGNPPYVRMELLKPIKPYLESRYAVVSDRADLYAYFFELGVRILKPGGRLGYISSSTFFRTGSGAPLRRYLGEAAQIEAVVDFGDLQLFEGVTTYPAIITLRRAGAGDGSGTLRFLNLKALPPDLSLAFDEAAEPMPRARLTAGSWRFEGDRLDAIRAKMAAGRKTLAEVYGPPLRGIVTGLNRAFVLARDTRDALIARDRRSADLLKPFLIGENLKRWHVESDDLWLIYTPKNRIDIEDYPAIRDHLAPFRERLESRATSQNWWELQQAQAAYAQHFEAPKIMYPSISQGPKFSLVKEPLYSNDKTFMIRSGAPALVAYLGSKPSWLTLFGEASPLRGGQWRLELREQYVSRLPVLNDAPGFMELAPLGVSVQASHEALATIKSATLHRLTDIAPAIKTTAAFRAWPDLDFAALRTLIAKRCRAEFPVAERDQWEAWYAARRTEVAALKARIADAEAEINARTYALFGLDTDEIAAIEESLAGQY